MKKYLTMLDGKYCVWNEEQVKVDYSQRKINFMNKGHVIPLIHGDFILLLQVKTLLEILGYVINDPIAHIELLVSDSRRGLVQSKRSLDYFVKEVGKLSDEKLFAELSKR